MLLRRCLTFLHGKNLKCLKIGRRPNTAVERLVYSTLVTIFDTLDAVLQWARPFDKRPEDRVSTTTHSPPSFALSQCFDAAHRV